MGGRNPAPVAAQTLEREAAVLQLRQARYTFQQIADQVGLSSRSEAHRYYRQALARVHAPEAGELRKLEGESLDELQTAVYAKALRGDVRAVREVLRIMERRARLFGLDHADGIAERTLQLEQDKVRLVAVALFKVFDELGLDEEQRKVGTRILLAELRAADQEATDPGPDDDPPKDTVPGVVVADDVDDKAS